MSTRDELLSLIEDLTEEECAAFLAALEANGVSHCVSFQ